MSNSPPDSAGAIRDRLLSQVASPKADSIYRQELNAMLERQERGLRIEKIGATALWCFAVLLGTLFLLIGGFRPEVSPAITMELLGIFVLISAAVELLKYFISRSRVELLRAIKSLEVEVLELKDQVQQSTADGISRNSHSS